MFVNETCANKQQGNFDILSQEPVFKLSCETRLNIGNQSSQLKTIDFFTHQIARNPQNLRAHAQKITYLISVKETARLFGALIDLFIALDKNGEAFKSNMIDASGTLLNETELLFFKDKLQLGLNKRDAIPETKYSILSNGFRGSYKLVKKTSASIELVKKLLDESHLEIEKGNMDKARIIMEDAVIQIPSSKTLNLQLLKIYRSTQDFNHFNKMFIALNNKEMTLKEEWILMKKYLEKVV